MVGSDVQAGWDRKASSSPARHTAATAALAAGLPVTEGSAMLGHSNSATTLRVYAHVTADGGAKLAAALDSWLRSVPGDATS